MNTLNIIATVLINMMCISIVDFNSYWFSNKTIGFNIYTVDYNYRSTRSSIELHCKQHLVEFILSPMRRRFQRWFTANIFHPSNRIVRIASDKHVLNYTVVYHIRSTAGHLILSFCILDQRQRLQRTISARGANTGETITTDERQHRRNSTRYTKRDIFSLHEAIKRNVHSVVENAPHIVKADGTELCACTMPPLPCKSA